MPDIERHLVCQDHRVRPRILVRISLAPGRRSGRKRRGRRPAAFAAVGAEDLRVKVPGQEPLAGRGESAASGHEPEPRPEGTHRQRPY